MPKCFLQTNARQSIQSKEISIQVKEKLWPHLWGQDFHIHTVMDWELQGILGDFLVQLLWSADKEKKGPERSNSHRVTHTDQEWTVLGLLTQGFDHNKGSDHTCRTIISANQREGQVRLEAKYSCISYTWKAHMIIKSEHTTMKSLKLKICFPKWVSKEQFYTVEHLIINMVTGITETTILHFFLHLYLALCYFGFD